MTITSANSERPLYGAAMIVGGMMLIGVIDNFVRVMADHIGLWQFHTTRTAIAVPLILCICFFFGRRYRPTRWRAPLIRTALIVMSMLLYFGSLPMAPIAQVGAGLFTSPIWVLVFSALFLGTRVGPRRVLAVLFGFSGAMMILRPWEAGFTIWSVIPVIAGMFYALAMIVTRRWCADEPPLALNLLFFSGLGIAGLIGMGVLAAYPMPELAQTAPFFFSGWVWPVADVAWIVIGVQSVGSIIAVLMLTIGYQSAETSFMTLFEYTFLISASLTGFYVWGERLDALSFVGMAMIVASGTFIAMRSAQT